MFQHVGIIGLGLLGGSLAQAIKNKQLVPKVTGIARCQDTLAYAQEHGWIDHCFTEIQESLSSCDLIILCTPVNQILQDIASLANYVHPKTLVTDVGSTKQDICRQGRACLPHFIGSHPLAGSEKTGLEHSRSDLFENRFCIITSDPEDNRDTLIKLEDFWVQLGAKVAFLTTEEHDRIMAYTSHLPHLIAANLIQSLAVKDSIFTAKGFWDTTRVASGSPQMWRDICQSNKKYLLEACETFKHELEQLKQMIQNDQTDDLQAWLQKAKEKRDQNL